MRDVLSRSGRSRSVGVVAEVVRAGTHARPRARRPRRRRAARGPRAAPGPSGRRCRPARCASRPARRRRWPGLRQPCSLPGAVVGRVDLVDLAVGLGDPAGRDRVRRAGPHERHVAERLLDRLVAARAVRAEVGADVHRRRLGLLDDLRHDVLGLAAAHDQPAAVRAQVLVQRAQGAVEEGDPRRARRLRAGRGRGRTGRPPGRPWPPRAEQDGRAGAGRAETTGRTSRRKPAR